MSADHETRRRGSASLVSEPVQVYLARPDSDRLERLATELAATKSDVLRRGLAALEREVLDPARDPLLRLIDIGGAQAGRPATDPGYDVAREHDRYLADAETGSWVNPPKVKHPKGRRGA